MGPDSLGGTGEEQPFKLLRADGADERFADFGEDHPVEGVALQDLAAHQPVAKGAHRARIGLDGALTADGTRLVGVLRIEANQATDIGGVDLSDQGDGTALLLGTAGRILSAVRCHSSVLALWLPPS